MRVPFGTIVVKTTGVSRAVGQRERIFLHSQGVDGDVEGPEHSPNPTSRKTGPSAAQNTEPP